MDISTSFPHWEHLIVGMKADSRVAAIAVSGGLCTTFRHSPSHVSAESGAVVLDIHDPGWTRSRCRFFFFFFPSSSSSFCCCSCCCCGSSGWISAMVVIRGTHTLANRVSWRLKADKEKDAPRRLSSCKRADIYDRVTRVTGDVQRCTRVGSF